MPVPEKKSTTSTPDPETFGQVGWQLPDQNTFHQHLREQIRRAGQAVMEEVMRDELTKFLGAQWGKVTPDRHDYRNASYNGHLATPSGYVQNLRVPRDG